MTKTTDTYAGRSIYKATVDEKYGGLDKLYFQCFDGSTWKKEAKAFDSWWGQDGFANKIYPTTSNYGSFVDYNKDRLHGNFGSGWKDYTFENGSVSITLSANTTYEFGVRYPKDSDWKGQTGSSNMKRSDNSWTLNGSNNVKLDADVAGSYTFSITDNSGNPKLTVTYPTCTATKPTVTTAEADDVTEDSATLGGNVTDAGISTSCSAQTVSERGIEWTNSSGIPSGTKVKAATGGTGTFTVSAKSLTGGTTYYYKAYATNATGTSYGDMESFTTETPCTPPTVTTAAASNITADEATVGGSYEGGTDTPTSVGIEWTAGTTGSVEIASSGTTPFSKTITGLSSGTTYTYKAYVMACGSKVYASETKSFKTLCVPTNPSVSTVGATSIGTTYATIGCNVTSAGMNSDCSTPSITARGIEWTKGESGTEPIGSGTGSLTKQITGLTPGTEYKYRAFATNDNGTSYGDEETFTTTCPTPSKPSLTCTSDNNRVLPGTKAAFTVNTESGATYQLYANSAATGSPVTGDGTAKTLTSGADMGNSAVTYYVKACSNVASCTSSCNQSENLEVKPLTIWVRGEAVGSWDNGTQMTQNGQVFSLEFSNQDDNKEFKYLYEDGWGDENEAIYNDANYSKGTDVGVSWTFAGFKDGKRENSSSGTISTGYETPKTLYINPITKKVWIEAKAKSCEPPTSVTTTAAGNIKSTSATLGGEWTGGTGTPDEVGIEWVSGKSGKETSSSNPFTVNATGLTAGTAYTYKAYAIACGETVYGDIESVTTCTVPVMAQATKVTTDYSTDYLKYNVKASSLGCAVTEWGLNVYTDNNCTQLLKSVQGSGDLATTNKVVAVDGLNANTAYYVKAYAKYDGGSSTTDGTKTGWQTKVAIGDASATSVTNNSATLNSSTGAGGNAATAFTALFRYSTNESTIASGTTIQSSATAAGQAITADLSGLSAGTTYYYRVEITYKEAGSGNNVTLVGATKSFTTLNVHGAITGLPASPLAKCSADEPLQLAPQCSTATSWVFNSNNPSVATVTSEGLITAVAEGTATITVIAKADGYLDKSVEITVNVSASPTLSLEGVSPIGTGVNATYTWDYITITATSDASTLNWEVTTVPAGFTTANYIWENTDGNTNKVYRLKSKQPSNPSTDKFVITVTANGANCNTVKTFEVSVDKAEEVCNN
ncbi:MAG: Ig-like domain-containing protein [Paludibacteraceae bacterium]|nr:Ig-like domain-containing protein [Paludibacteraceae bacterium]